MIIFFKKLPGNRHEIEVTDRKGPDIVRPARETGPTIPHDLAHAAVEAALGLSDGFWGAIERGATFDDFKTIGQRHRRSGLKVLRRLGEPADRAEAAVSWAHRVWSGARTQGRGLGAPPIGPETLAIAIASLDRAKTIWDALPDGGTLNWRWSHPRGGDHFTD